MAVLGWLLIIIYYLMVIGNPGKNLPPVIHKIKVSPVIAPSTLRAGLAASVRAFATDPDGDKITYIWGSAMERIQLDRFQDDRCTYIAPAHPGIDFIWLIVSDDTGAANRDFVTIIITDR
jgi:hypothetical protein